MKNATENSRLDQPFAMRLRVWDSGYQWVDTQKGGRLLTRNPPARKTRNPRALNRHWPYREVPAFAFREFATISTTEEGILAFAEKYGDILNTHPLEAATNGSLVAGSTLASWREAVEDLRFWVGVWDCLRLRKAKKLREWVLFTEDGPEFISQRSVIKIPASSFEEVIFARNEVYRPTRVVLRDVVNERLSEYPTRTRLGIVEPGSGAAESAFRLDFVPENLLAILWMQFASSIMGKLDVQRCEKADCGKYFRPERSTRRFCSDICRVEAWNVRRTA